MFYELKFNANFEKQLSQSMTNNQSITNRVLKSSNTKQKLW